MAYVRPNAAGKAGSSPFPRYISRFLEAIRHEISSRILERRIYNESMRELWSMPDTYRLELGIDPYHWERFARETARREAGR